MEIDNSLRDRSRELVQRHYSDLDPDASGGRKVVYLFTTGLISELFRSFDFAIAYPELNAIQSSRHRLSVDLIHDSELLGYAPNICSYVKCDLGLLAGPSKGQAVFGKIPPPDLIVVNHCGCSTYIKWGQALSDKFGCPVKIIDVPFIREERPTRFDHEYVRRQIEELIPICVEISGSSFDEDRLREILWLTSETIDLWVKMREFGKLKPSPFDVFFEGVSYMAPMTMWRGTVEARDFYKFANEKIWERIKSKYTPYGKEDFRLLYEGSPPWPSFGEFWRMFKNWSAVGVASTYVNVSCAPSELEFGPEKPFDYLASLATQSYYNWNLEKRRNFIEKLAGDYEVDAVIIHSVRSCRPSSVGQLDMRNYFARDRGIPALYLDSDVADPRYFSSAQIQNRINTFFEALSQRKRSIRKEIK